MYWDHAEHGGKQWQEAVFYFLFFPRSFDPAFPRRRLLARVSRLERLEGSETPDGLASIELDAIDREAGNVFGALGEKDLLPFALLRITATEKELVGTFGILPEPGDWYDLRIEPSEPDAVVNGGLRTLHAQLGAGGYGPALAGVTRSATPLSDGSARSMRRARSAAAARPGLPILRLPNALAAACAGPGAVATADRLSALLGGIGSPDSVLIRDVAQASFSTLLDAAGRPLLHYDVGLPLPFHPRGRSAELRVADDGRRPPVVLSHWDWDHLQGAYAFPHLLDCHWVVPSQRLGPGAARLAGILRRRGRMVVRPTRARTHFAFGELSKGLGAVGDNNNTGLAMRVRLGNRRTVLMMGDLEYRDLPHCTRGTIDHLVATHHGARFASKGCHVPRPSLRSGGELVLSCGPDNLYGHPHPLSLRMHEDAGWSTVSSTAEVGEVLLA